MTPTETKIPIAKPGSSGERAMRADALRNRDAILAAARGRFADQGWNTQMDDIARDAGVGVGTVYRHFPTKEELLEALIEDRFTTLAARAVEAAAEAREGDAWEAFEGYIRFATELQSGDRSLSEAMADRSHQLACFAEESGLVAACIGLIETCKRAGALRKDFEMEDIPAMICSVGAVSIAAAEKPRMRWERVVTIWLDGVRAPASSKLPPIPD